MTIPRVRSSETRTLLFSDIEGSTRLLDAAGDRYPEILATHRRLIREATSRHNGTEQSTDGDAFFLIFQSVRDGLGAALDAQLALRDNAWESGLEVRVRMGLHVGEITWSDDDVVGVAIHEAARVMSAGHGGQILVSPVAWELSAGSRPDDVTVLNLGPHHLKDFDEPVDLLQICHPGLRTDFPRPRTRAALLDLPAPRTDFVGREREVADVLDLLREGRHVTLTGVGGSGKTRLALQVATLDAVRHPDGCFFVDLAPVPNAEGMLGAVANGVKAQGDPSDLKAMITHYLSDRRALIVLDNCEHLVDECADTVDLVLAECPSMTVLATSREALQIDGEQTFSVPSLTSDDQTSEAVRLFVSRARAVKSDFVVTEANRSDVLAVCQRLDGIPLAIELAAGRVDHLSVADIARRLDDRFGLLVGGRRRRVQRQQTLQAAMDWSWDLLDDAEKELLRRLAVFTGPFALESAEEICVVESTIGILGSLVAKSLVSLEAESGTTRYRLLETVRLYAQDRLVDAGEAEAMRDAHRDWYLALCEDYSIDDILESRAMTRLSNDYGNVRAAMDWSMSQGRSDLFARQLLKIALALIHQPGSMEETSRALLWIANDEAHPAAVRADAFAALAMAAMVHGDFASIHPYASRSIEIDDSDREYYVMALFAIVQPGAAGVALRLDQPAMARMCRAWQADATIFLDPHRAVEQLEQIFAELEPDTAGWDHLFTLAGLAVAHLLLGEGARASDAAGLLRKSLDYFDDVTLGSLRQLPDAYKAMALAQLDRCEEARAVLRDATGTVLRDRYPLAGNECLVALAYINACEGDPLSAARLLEPVVRDGRMRWNPSFSLVFWILDELNSKLADLGVDSPLPDIGTAVTRILSISRGEWTNDTEAAAEIHQSLMEFVT